MLHDLLSGNGAEIGTLSLDSASEVTGQAGHLLVCVQAPVSPMSSRLRAAERVCARLSCFCENSALKQGRWGSGVSPTLLNWQPSQGTHVFLGMSCPSEHPPGSLPCWFL